MIENLSIFSLVRDLAEKTNTQEPPVEVLVRPLQAPLQAIAQGIYFIRSYCWLSHRRCNCTSNSRAFGGSFGATTGGVFAASTGGALGGAVPATQGLPFRRVHIDWACSLLSLLFRQPSHTALI